MKEILELAPGIIWVGVVDWGVKDFHSFHTPHGATYNSYLIQDEKTAVIDAVKGLYAKEQLNHIREEGTDWDKVDYVVCNHAEPDHASGLATLLKNLPNATLLCNAKCKETLAGYFGNEMDTWKIQIVTPEDTISLGKRTLSFINTPMVHWPESMFTYIPEEKILFCMDAFGQHIATMVRFADQCHLPFIMAEAKSYYANIVTPYGKQVQNVLKLAETIPVSILATSHGLIWRKNISQIISAYQDWSTGKQVPKVVVLYDSMWDSTTMMAEAIGEGAKQIGDKVEVQVLHVRKTSLTNIATEMLDAAAVAFGSPTLNMQMMPQMGAVLTYLSGLKFSPKSAISFGSHGWFSAAPGLIDQWITQNGWSQLGPSIQAKFRPSVAQLEQCYQAGRALAEIALKKDGGG